MYTQTARGKKKSVFLVPKKGEGEAKKVFFSSQGVAGVTHATLSSLERDTLELSPCEGGRDLDNLQEAEIKREEKLECVHRIFLCLPLHAKNMKDYTSRIKIYPVRSVANLAQEQRIAQRRGGNKDAVSSLFSDLKKFKNSKQKHVSRPFLATTK